MGAGRKHLSAMIEGKRVWEGWQQLEGRRWILGGGDNMGQVEEGTKAGGREGGEALRDGSAVRAVQHVERLAGVCVDGGVCYSWPGFGRAWFDAQRASPEASGPTMGTGLPWQSARVLFKKVRSRRVT